MPVPIHQDGAQDQIYYSHMAQEINSKVGNSWSCFKTRLQDKTKSSQFWAISAKQAILSTQIALHLSNLNKTRQNLNAEPRMLDKHHQINTSSILTTGDEGMKWWLYDLRLWDWLLSSNHSSCPTRWSLYWPLALAISRNEYIHSVWYTSNHGPREYLTLEVITV